MDCLYFIIMCQMQLQQLTLNWWDGCFLNQRNLNIEYCHFTLVYGLYTYICMYTYNTCYTCYTIHVGDVFMEHIKPHNPITPSEKILWRATGCYLNVVEHQVIHSWQQYFQQVIEFTCRITHHVTRVDSPKNDLRSIPMSLKSCPRFKISLIWNQ